MGIKKPKIRGVWTINPRTRIKKSKKIYRRSRDKKTPLEDKDMSV